MRRIVAGFVCLLVLGGAVGGAAAKSGGGAEAVRGAGALWWQHGEKTGTLYFLDVYDALGTYSERPASYRAFFGAIPCKVGRRDRPTGCNWRLTNVRRVRVDSLEIDPLMNSARAVVYSGGKRGVVNWTGRGDYGQPFLWQSVGQFFAPPHFAQAHASVIAYMGRSARARGDLFGLDLKRSEFRGAGMYDIVYANANACLMGPWCWFGGAGPRVGQP